MWLTNFDFIKVFDGFGSFLAVGTNSIRLTDQLSLIFFISFLQVNPLVKLGFIKDGTLFTGGFEER